jgi:SAM-dependent methyltransferase
MESNYEYKYLSQIYDVCKSSFWDNYFIRINSFFTTPPKRVLDLGCGTGLAINHLNCSPNHYIGVDASEAMLQVAKKKFPAFDFQLESILMFKQAREFDLVLSAFDTMNHLLKINDWQKAFRTARHHLSAEGYFIFDVVTQHDHQFNWPGQVNVTESNEWLYIQKSEFDNEKKIACLKNTIFLKEKNFWLRFDEEIHQISLPISTIMELLRYEDLECCQILDLETGSAPKNSSTTILFVCKVKTN